MSLEYKNAGVDIAAGDALVDWLKTNRPQKWPHQDRLVSGIGGFAALFRGDFPEMKKPLIVSSTDGVGTKVKLAIEFGAYQGVGQDLVGMCVNDLICSGAHPLFFLDYFACGRLNLDVAKEFLKGVQSACLESQCILIGGETAEMPGVYQGQDFDCAGFAVGVVDEPKVLGGHRVQDGDRLIGVASSGFHSNGFSLLRKVFAADFEKWRDVLLEPTRLYVNLALDLYELDGLRAMAHITGGGMDNLLRVLPDDARAVLKPWRVPAPFLEVKRRTGMKWDSLLTTLNCGLGLIIVASPTEFDEIRRRVAKQGFESFDLGVIERGQSEKSWSLDFSQMGEA